MGCYSILLLFSLLWSLLILGSCQLQPSQKQVLLQLRKQLEYPKPLEVWLNSGGSDLCYLSSSQVNISCENNFVTELRIIGDKHSRASNFDGFAMQDFTLSPNFSMDSLVATLSRLTSLRVLSLVSLGIWGPIPDKIHRLISVEEMDLSWNYLYGSIPQTVSRIVKLQSLNLDGNFFNGSFPDWFGSLANLSSLSLKSNQLSGELPSSIKSVTTLTYISLSNNRISGQIPDLSGLSSLNFLDLSNNRLDSALPRMPKGLVVAFLGNNSLSGVIPKPYSDLNRLQQLDLSNNNLEGSPPSAIFALPSIAYLNLSSNMLSGSFPSKFICGSVLGSVDISNNKFKGQLPSCLSAASKNKTVKFDGNCLSNDIKHQHPETDCLEDRVEEQKSKRMNVGVLIGIIVAIVVVLIILAFGFLVMCRVYCPRGTSEQHLLRKPMQDNSVTRYPSELLMNARFISETAKLGTQSAAAHRLFSIDELREATNDFDRINFMGAGSTGKMFKGQLENGGRVAIRCLNVSKKFTLRNFRLRLDLLSKLRHPHLVCLLGHCIDGERKDHPGASKVYLVYEYVQNGNYRAHLSEKNPEKALNWSERLTILTSIAKAVHFLHTGVIPGFFSNRLKANNILLNEHGVAKLSDYGLSIIQEDIDRREVSGEALRSWQMKSLGDDIYSFGIILLESFAGPSYVSARPDSFLLDEMASFESRDDQNQKLDQTVLNSCSRESLSIVISITKKCISLESASRPSFEDILWNLQYAAQVQETGDGDQRYEMMLR